MRLIVVYSLSLVCLLTGCKKEFDNPPLKPVNETARVSVRELKARTVGSNSLYRFAAGDTNFYCTVTMDENNGNIYKQIFVRDDEGEAILIKLTASGGLYTGDRIRINLNNTWLVCGNNMVYLDSISPEKSIVKLSSGNLSTPVVTSLSKLLSYSNSPKEDQNLQSQLVELNGVEFYFSDRNKPFANAIGRTSLEYLLTDCDGRQIEVRTSGMCNFASKLTPSGNGKLIGVVQQYNNSMSLLIREYKELQMNNTPCVTAPPTTITGQVFLQKTFDDNSLAAGGWTNVASTGTISWITSDFAHGSYYARIYNKVNSVYEPCESWLISPAFDLSGSKAPVISFQSANSSSASPLALMVSTNYYEGAPGLATWTAISFNAPKGNFEFISSGLIPLENFKAPNVRVAFRYSGTATSGSIWQLDDISVYDPEK